MLRHYFERVCFCIVLVIATGLCYLLASSVRLYSIEPKVPTASSALPIYPAFERPHFTGREYLPIVPDYEIPPIKNGLAPVLIRIPTKQPVVFLGIDDGVHRDPSQLRLMQMYKIKASLFLTESAIHKDSKFFKPFINAGSLVENHTVHHELMSKLTYGQQKREICKEADKQAKQYGRRPVLFRPPGGDYNLATRRAAAACGMKAVVNWVAKANGGSMQYQVGDHLRPGDIVLMHFRPEFKDDMEAFVKARDDAGLQTDLLENWLPRE